MMLRKKKHVAIVCPACDGEGSVGNVALRHATEMSHYFKVTLISDSFPRHELPGINLCKVAQRRFNFLHRFCHVPNEISFARAVHSKLKMQHKEDTIHMVMCHGHVLATLAAIPLKKKFGIPYGITIHGDIFDRPRGTYDWWLTTLYKVVTPSAYRNADFIQALSPHIASCALRRGARDQMVKLLPNGIDPSDIGLDILDNLIDSRKVLSDGVLKLLYVGGITEVKGVNVLIETCGILKEKKINFTLQLIGSGNLESQLQHRINQLGLSHHVHFLGKLPRKALGRIYKAADIVCVPSLNDSLPTVVLESLVSGTPVIGSNVCGIPYMVETGKNGVLVSPGDATAISEIIEDLYKDKKKLQYLKINSRPSVLPKFSWKVIGEEIQSQIQKSIDNAKFNKN